MTKIVFSALRLIFILVLCAGSFSHAWAQQVVRDIQVEGAQRLEPATVRSYMSVQPGDTVDRRALDKSLKSLFATGLFADVSLRQSGDSLIVSVVENPVINQIAFEGNDKINDDALKAEISLRPRHVFTRTKVQSDVARLYQVYRRAGRFSVNIEPKVIKLDQNRVNLVFEVNEGGVTKVRSIRFVGNEHFDDDRLRREISTAESAWYSFISSDDRYDPDRLAYDQELLRRFYYSQGYADFQLISAVAELSNDRDNFFITFTVEEGERYKISSTSVSSQLRNFDSSVLEQHIIPEAGEWYDAGDMQKSVDVITDALGDLQYAFVNVRPELKRNREERTVDIVFEVSESPRVFVERIDVKGNVRTHDKVVRREMLVVEGDPFNKSKLARSEQRLRNLNFFETASLNVVPGSAPDKTIVEAEVVEKSTGELSIGAGFSSADGPLADLRIRERNFLGKGQDLLFSTTIAGERTQFDVSFTEPYFLDRDLSAGVDLFHTTRDLHDESSYDQRRTGAGLRIGYPLSDKWRQTWRYRAERNEITDVDDNASIYIQQQEGARDTSAVSQHLSYDDRDSKIQPTEGLLYWLDAEVAGLGGDAKYVSAKTGASYYIPLADRWTLNFLGETGAIEGYGDTNVQINERFFLGASTLRGFERAGIGPRDSLTEDALGGNYFYRGSAETTFPLGLPEEFAILGHVFSDAGTLWEVDDTDIGIDDESSLRVSVGAGLSWRSPFGPVRVDFAVPLMQEDEDREENFQFNFGTRF